VDASERCEVEMHATRGAAEVLALARHVIKPAGWCGGVRQRGGIFRPSQAISFHLTAISQQSHSSLTAISQQSRIKLISSSHQPLTVCFNIAIPATAVYALSRAKEGRTELSYDGDLIALEQIVCDRLWIFLCVTVS
jgi:hypothetical protein